MSDASSPRLGSTRIYTGRVLNLELDRVRFPNGSEGTLEMIRHPGASAVLPVVADGADPRVLLIRQYRYAAEQFLWEVPAGRLDPGETPLACAQRELLEETGYSAARVEALGAIYTTPGFTDERIHLYLARELTAGESRREPDEFIELVELRLSEALEKVDAGEIVDGKTIATLTLGYRRLLTR